MVWFIENGFVAALLAGNAVAVHDIEVSIFGTTLGMTRTGEATTDSAVKLTGATNRHTA